MEKINEKRNEPAAHTTRCNMRVTCKTRYYWCTIPSELIVLRFGQGHDLQKQL